MAKSKTKGKAPERTYEVVLEELNAAKAAQKENNAALASLRKKNTIKKGETPSDKKLAKELKTLEEAAAAGKELVDTLTQEAKSLKPRKDRVTKYEYPEGATASDKKKIRAQARAEARKAEKAENSDASTKKGKTSTKKGKTSSKAESEKPAAKKGKKPSKKATQEQAED